MLNPSRKNAMKIEDAQRDVRTVFLGGFAGQLVAAVLWFLSAALGTWDSVKTAVMVLAIGGVFIFPVTQIVLRLRGGCWEYAVELGKQCSNYN
jgi:hypothetical protein